MVAPSNPDILYVGSGEGLQRPDLSVGDGVYRSTDAGDSWAPIVRDLPPVLSVEVQTLP